MLKDRWIKVYSDEHDPQAQPTRVMLRRNMTLNNFRRECSQATGIDVVSMFTRDSRRISDTSDLENVLEIIVSRLFYLRKDWGDSGSPVMSRGPTIRSPADASSEKQLIVARVEIVALPNTGKTTLIQRFLQHDSIKTQQNLVVEAVYHQKIDIKDHIIEYILTDVIEDRSVPVISERAFQRDVVLLAISKQTLLELLASDGLQETWRWVKSSCDKIREVSPHAYVALLLCKYDIICDSENVINEQLRGLPPSLPILKVSALEGMAVADVMNPHQLFSTIGTALIKRRGHSSHRHVKELLFKDSPVVNPRFFPGLRLPSALGGAYNCLRGFLG